jgi:integrase
MHRRRERDQSTLTETTAKDAQPPTDGRDQVIILDRGHKRAIRGFGLRVTKGGVKSWVLTYTTRGGRDRRLTIGRWPDWPVEAARTEAGKLRRRIDDGVDPLQEREEERAADDVNALADRYLDEHVKIHNRSSTKSAVESLLDQYIRPQLGKLKVKDVMVDDVQAMHRKITARGRRHRANRALATLSKMMNLAIKWRLREVNPVVGVIRNQEGKRNRYLSGDETKCLMAALAVYPDKPAANVIRLLLLTGARRGEALGAMWAQFDLKKAIWVKPGRATKQRTEHRVPLSPPAVQILADMRKADPDGTRLFPPGLAGKMRDHWFSITEAAGISGVRMHDLRHSFASFLASAGLPLSIIGALLGHTQPSTTARYAHLFDDPLRAAAKRVGEIVTGHKPTKRRKGTKSAKVIAMKRARL